MVALIGFLAVPSQAPAAAPSTSQATFFVGARKGDQFSVLVYRAATGALAPFGPPLPLPTPPPNYERSAFRYVLSARPDRVFVVVSTFDGWKTYAGDGTRWNLLSENGGHPHMSDDGTLILLGGTGMVNGQQVAVERVMTWDAKVVDEWSYQVGVGVGFVEHGPEWVTVRRLDKQREVHAQGAPPRPATSEVVFDDNAHGTARDRFRVVDDGSTTLRRTGRMIARYTPAQQAGTNPAEGAYVVGTALAGPHGVALMRHVYTAGWCECYACPHSTAIDLWEFDETGWNQTRRLRLMPGLGDMNTMLDAKGTQVAWFAAPDTLEVFDIASGTRRRIKTDYELVFAQSLRR